MAKKEQRYGRYKGNRGSVSAGRRKQVIKERFFYILTYTVVIYGYTLFFLGYQWLKFYNDSDSSVRQYAMDNRLFFILASCYLVTIILQYVFKSGVKITSDGTYFGGAGPIVMRTGLGWITVFLIQLIITFLFEPVKFNISKLEIYLFYITGGLAEEFFYRGFLQQTLFDITFIGTKRKNKLLAGIVSICIASPVFGISHVIAYKGEIISIVSITLSGFVLGTVYYLSKGNVIETCIIHAINNLTAVIIRDRQGLLFSNEYVQYIFIPLILLSVYLVFHLVRKFKTKIQESRETRIVDRSTDLQIVLVAMQVLMVIAIVVGFVGIVFPDIYLVAASSILIFIDIFLLFLIHKILYLDCEDLDKDVVKWKKQYEYDVKFQWIAVSLIILCGIQLTVLLVNTGFYSNFKLLTG